MGRASCSYPSNNNQPGTPKMLLCICSNRMQHTQRRRTAMASLWTPRASSSPSLFSIAVGISGSEATDCFPAGRTLVQCIRGLSSTPWQQAHVRVQPFESIEPCSWLGGWRIASSRRFIDEGTHSILASNHGSYLDGTALVVGSNVPSPTQCQAQRAAQRIAKVASRVTA